MTVPFTYIWDALTGLQVLEIKPPGWHPAWGVWVWSVACSPDGKHVVSGSSDGAIRIFDATTGEKLHELTGHSRHVSTVAYRSDGDFLLSASHDGTLRIWNATGFDALPAPPISI
jgi:WD40 repeat protein